MNIDAELKEIREEFDRNFVHVRNNEPKDDQFCGEKYLPRKVKDFYETKIRKLVEERDTKEDVFFDDVLDYAFVIAGSEIEAAIKLLKCFESVEECISVDSCESIHGCLVTINEGELTYEEGKGSQTIYKFTNL